MIRISIAFVCCCFLVMTASSARASPYQRSRRIMVFRVRLLCFAGLSDRATLDDVVGIFVLDAGSWRFVAYSQGSANKLFPG